MKLFKSVLVIAQLALASTAFAETLPPDELASPLPGEQPGAPLSLESGFADPDQPFDKTWELTDSFGNANWGGRYRMYERMVAMTPKKQVAVVKYWVKGMAFGHTYTGLDFTATAANDKDDERRAKMRLVVAGDEKFDDYEKSTALYSTVEAHQNLLPFDVVLGSTSKSFGLGPFSISVTANMRVDAGINVTARAYHTGAVTSGASLIGTGGATVYGRMSAGIDAWLASAGISGEITFAKLHVSHRLKLARTANQVAYKNLTTLKLSSLQGFLEIYASFLGADWDKVIFDWNGYNTSFLLANVDGTVVFPLVSLTLDGPSEFIED